MKFFAKKTLVQVAKTVFRDKKRAVWAAIPALLIFLTTVGCSPQHYRQKADREVYSLVRHSACDREAALCDFTIDIDKRSRMYDPFDPDHEPMFRDDPCAHRLMHCVDCKKIGKKCKRCKQTAWADNPCWRQYLIIDEDGDVFLNKEAVIELALRHSPEYQKALENVYLSALAVSNQRFRYDVQFFGGESLFYTASGDLVGASNGSTVASDAKFGLNKKFATGAELMVSMANSVTWQFAGPDRFEANSLFNLNFVQPLLREAGKKIVLEELTQAERNLLANVRQMVFYRQGYYAKVLTGSSGPSLPAVGRPSPGAGGVGNSRGYYELLAEQIKIQNQEQNLVSLEDNVNQMEEQFQAIRDSRRTKLSVEEMRQQFYTSQTRLLQQKNSYLTTVENYLVSTLGLPPDLPVKVQDPLLEQFQLISKRMTDLQGQTQTLLLSLRREDLIDIPAETFQTIGEILEGVEKEMVTIDHDYQTMQQKIPERSATLQVLAAQIARSPSAAQQIDPRIFDVEQLKSNIETIRERFEMQHDRIAAVVTLVNFLQQTEPVALFEILKDKTLSPDVAEAVYALELHEILDPAITDTYVYQHKVDGREITISQEMALYRIWLNRVIDQLSFQILETALCQARIRLNSITLVPVSISAEQAFAVAAENRLDWMNARAALVDSWRKIRVAANALKSDLSIQVKGSAGTIENDSIKFDASNSQLSVGVAWDSPLTRHLEQSAYRTALINYQQARRDYYGYVDQANAEIRNNIRLLQRTQVEFEIQRSSIGIATTTVELAQLELIRPPKTPGESNSDNNLAQRIISALEKLLDAQNNFLDLWIGYESCRMGLDLQMGTLRLDSRGHWIDPGPITGDSFAATQPMTAEDVVRPIRDLTVPEEPMLAPQENEMIQKILDVEPPQPEKAGDEKPAEEKPAAPAPAQPQAEPAAPLPPDDEETVEKMEPAQSVSGEPKTTRAVSIAPASKPLTPAGNNRTRQEMRENPLKPAYHRPPATGEATKKANVTFVPNESAARPLTTKDAPPPPPTNL